MQTPSRVPRILLTVFAIIVGAVLAGLFTLVSAGGYRQAGWHKATEAESYALAFISLALGGLTGGGAGALWSLLMNRLPPTAGAARIMLRGTGLGAVAGPGAIVPAHLCLMIIYNKFDSTDNIFFLILLFCGIPAGLITGLACSFLAWGAAAWERSLSPPPPMAQSENTNAPRRAPPPPTDLTVSVILSSVLVSAAICGGYGYRYMPPNPGFACVIGALEGIAAGWLAARLWLLVMAKSFPDANSARTVLTGAALGAAEGAFAGPVIFLGLTIITNAESCSFVCAFLIPILLAVGALAGLIWGSILGGLVCASSFLERRRLAKQGH